MELKTTTINEPHGELNFTFQFACIYSFVLSKTRRMLALKANFGFDLIIPIDSLTSLVAKKIYDEFDNNVCALNKLDYAAYILRSAKS